MAEEKMAEIDRIALETAQLNLDEARDANAKRIAEKKIRERVFAERQRGMKSAAKTRAELSARCLHNQGGPMNNPYESDGKSALGVLKMPDGWTLMIKCPICRGEWFTPHTNYMRKEPFPARYHMPGGVILEVAETKRAAEIRVAKYHKDVEEFNRLLKEAKRKLTPEAAQVMDCGTTHQLINMETGQEVRAWRACDASAMAQAA